MSRPPPPLSSSTSSSGLLASASSLAQAAKEAQAATAASSAAAGGRQMQGSGQDGNFHSLDSDDEEAYETSKKVESLHDNDIEGQEDETIAADDGIQITPFNLNEEKEEGDFAKDGSFVWKKKKEDEATDSWLENIDWGKVKERTAAEQEKQRQDDEAESKAEADYDEMDHYRQMLSLLKPKESVAKALRRLGGGKKTTAQKLKEKKRIKEGKETKEEKSNRENMTELTGLADAVLTRSGHMEIYEETHESIAFKLKQHDEKDEDAELDAFLGKDDDGDDDGKAEEEPAAKRARTEVEPAASSSAETAADPVKAVDLDDQVRWEFRWKNEDGEEVHGPHSTEEMIKWQESGFFDKGVFVRKATDGAGGGGGGGDFNDVRRIDFELYT